LRASKEASGALDRPIADYLPLALDGGKEDEGVDAAGPYHLLHEIGRGGMGVVYLAARADGAYEQKVAVKILKRGVDTDEIVARFRLERLK
jgi:eukaryotic-like serine/threonine-protein kinase